MTARGRSTALGPAERQASFRPGLGPRRGESRWTSPTAAIAGIAKALAAYRRIGAVIAHMGRIARLEDVEGIGRMPPILDLERSARKSATTDNG